MEEKFKLHRASRFECFGPRHTDPYLYHLAVKRIINNREWEGNLTVERKSLISSENLVPLTHTRAT